MWYIISSEIEPQSLKSNESNRVYPCQLRIRLWGIEKSLLHAFLRGLTQILQFYHPWFYCNNPQIISGISIHCTLSLQSSAVTSQAAFLSHLIWISRMFNKHFLKKGKQRLNPPRRLFIPTILMESFVMWQHWCPDVCALPIVWAAWEKLLVLTLEESGAVSCQVEFCKHLQARKHWGGSQNTEPDIE